MVNNAQPKELIDQYNLNNEKETSNKKILKSYTRNHNY